MRIAGIIVNYRTAQLTAHAVKALLPELDRAGSFHVYVVDNDSGDGSFAQLREEASWQEWAGHVTLLQSARNGGYGYGINLAVEKAFSLDHQPDYFYVINSDASPCRGALERLVAFMDSHPDVGIAGSRVQGTDGTTQGCAFRYPSVFGEFENTAGIGAISRLLSRYIVAMPPPSSDAQIDWVSGTSMIIRREAMEDVGLFDERFFLYFEEVDFCRRLERAGWKSYYVAEAPITHIGCVSTGMLDKTKRMPRYWFKSRHHYFMKHHGRFYAIAADAAWLTGHLVGRIKYRLTRRGEASRPWIVSDFLACSFRDLLFSRKFKPGQASVAPKMQYSLAPVDRRAPEDIGLFELLGEDFRTYDADVWQPGLWAIVAHRIGRRAMTMRAGVARAAMTAVYEVLATVVDTVWGIQLCKSVRVGRRVRLWHFGCMLLNAREIGNDVHIRHGTTLGPLRKSSADNLPSIQDRVDLGSGVAVLGAVVVGHDATVGANSVVVKDVPPYATMLGVPARVVPA
jgi:GT2 family glycosyltransferase/serine acetyltransferase